MQIDLGAQSKPPGAVFIRDTDEQHFELDVLAASVNQPVLAVFWAPWSAPCKQMLPLLESAVNAAGGSVLMVKVNIDKNPGLAQALRIQSVPTIYAFFQGKPVDGFAGPKPEAEVRAFVGKLKSFAHPHSAAENNTEHAKKNIEEADGFFQQEKYTEALSRYSEALDLDTENMEALGGIGWCLLMQRDTSSAQEMLQQLTPAQLKNLRLKGLQFILSLSQQAEGLEDRTTLEQKRLKSPKDIQVCFDLALRYFAEGLLEKGIEMLVASIRQDRNWKDQKARIFLLEIFEALGPAHPLTSSGRRKLSAVLFS